MTTETQILTDEQIVGILHNTPLAPRPSHHVVFARAIEQAVLQSPEIQELGVLLRESRQQLPLAAQFWNEDDEPERGSRNVKLVMELIARIDAAMEEHP